MRAADGLIEMINLPQLAKCVFPFPQMGHGRRVWCMPDKRARAGEGHDTAGPIPGGEPQIQRLYQNTVRADCILQRSVSSARILINLAPV